MRIVPPEPPELRVAADAQATGIAAAAPIGGGLFLAFILSFVMALFRSVFAF